MSSDRICPESQVETVRVSIVDRHANGEAGCDGERQVFMSCRHLELTCRVMADCDDFEDRNGCSQVAAAPHECDNFKCKVWVL